MFILPLIVFVILCVFGNVSKLTHTDLYIKGSCWRSSEPYCPAYSLYISLLCHSFYGQINMHTYTAHVCRLCSQYVNPAFERLFGYKGDEICGQNSSDLTRSDYTKPDVINSIHSHLRAGQVISSFTTSRFIILSVITTALFASAFVSGVF